TARTKSGPAARKALPDRVVRAGAPDVVMAPHVPSKMLSTRVSAHFLLDVNRYQEPHVQRKRGGALSRTSCTRQQAMSVRILLLTGTGWRGTMMGEVVYTAWEPLGDAVGDSACWGGSVGNS